MSATCPTCDRDDFGSEQAMKIHHFQSHGESIANWDVKEFTCEWCEEPFHREVAEGDSRRFCSQRCAAKEMNKQRGNEIHSSPHSVRTEVLLRDNYTCQRCGCDVEDGKRASQQSAEVHHLIPKAAGGPDTPENLVTLCLQCHRDVHREMGHLHETAPELLEELRKVVCDEE